MRLKPAGDDGNGLSDKAIRKFVVALGSDLPEALDMMQADNVSHSDDASMPNQIANIKKRIETLSMNQNTKPVLPINGNDVMSLLNIKPGPHVKQLLDLVTDAWYKNPDITRDQALNIVKHAHTANEVTPYLDDKIKNPETDNMILVRSALSYDKNSQVYKAAVNYIKQKKQIAK